MPDISLIQPLCDVLEISLNELFSGEHIGEDEYRKKAEENISSFFMENQLANLKPVKYLFSVCANATLLVAGIELLVGLVGQFFAPAILQPMLINAAVWLLLFLASMAKLMFDKRRLSRLKQSGTYVGADVSGIIPAAFIQCGNYHTCRVTCHFMYEGRDYKATSNYYILSPFQREENLYAKVYFQKENPSQNSIELFQV